MAPWWEATLSLFCTHLVQALNATNEQPHFTVNFLKNDFSDDFFKDLSDAIAKSVWCGGESERCFQFRYGDSKGEVGENVIVITYIKLETDALFRIPILPVGEVAFLLKEIPHFWSGSRDARATPSRLIHGMRLLSWANLRDRHISSASVVLEVTHSSESVMAGASKRTFLEGETFDLKMAENLILTLADFNRMAWTADDNKRLPMLPKLLSSVDLHSELPDDQYFPDSTVMLFGIPDKIDAVVGVKLDFEKFKLGRECDVFPPLRGSEVSVVAMPVEVWPANKSENDVKLEVYCGESTSHSEIVCGEHGKAWVATKRDGTKRVLRPRSTQQTRISQSAKEDDFLVRSDNGDEEWKPLSVDDEGDYPIIDWEPRHLVKLSVRPENGTPSLEGAFFSSARGVLLPGGRSLTCFGTWLRLRPRGWEKYFEKGNSLRLEVGNCFMGEHPQELFDRMISSANPDEIQLAFMSCPSTMRKVIALELGQEYSFMDSFVGTLLTNSPIDIILFVSLEKDGSQDRVIKRDESYEQLIKVITALKVLHQFNVVDVMPILPFGRHPRSPDSLDFPMPLPEWEVREKAKLYYTHESGQ